MLKIETAHNGWILTDEYENEEGEKIESKTVFSYDDECDEDTARKNEIESFIKLLWNINEHIGVLYSKHRKYNLNIECEEQELEKFE